MIDIQAHTAHFWKFAKELTEPHSLEDAFANWANTTAIPIETAHQVWASVQIDVADAFHKTAAITISGDPEELQALMKSPGNISTEPKINAPKVENPLKKLPGGPAGTAPTGAPGGLPGGMAKPAIPEQGNIGGAPPSEEPMLLDELANE